MVSITEVPLSRHYDSKFVPRHVLKPTATAARKDNVVSPSKNWDVRYQKRGTFVSKDLTTCILPHEPHVLQVVLGDKTTVELELQNVLSTGLVAVHGTILPRNVVDIRCMDVYGNFMTCRMKKQEEETMVISSVHTCAFPMRNNVRISCAAYYEGPVWIIGQSPMLYAWDTSSTTEQSVTSWTPQRCYFPTNTNTNWKQVLTDAAGLWMGKTNWNSPNINSMNQEESNDNIPVSALTVIRNTQTNKALGLVTLYADSTIKLWISPSDETCDLVKSSSSNSINPWILPERCRTLQLVQTLPSSSVWSPEWDSISITSSTTTKKQFTVALSIRTAWNTTTTTTTNTTDSSTQTHVIWMQGSLEALPQNVYQDESFMLPISSNTLNGWTFENESTLHILWNQALSLSLERYTLKDTLTPIASHESFQNKRTLQRHECKDCHWLPSTTHSKQETATLAYNYYPNEKISSLEKNLEQMNQWYMKLLFVSSSPSSLNCVKLALSLLFTSYSPSSSNQSIEWDTLMTLRAASLSSATTTTAKVVSPKLTNSTTITSPDSIYYRFKNITGTSTSVASTASPPKMMIPDKNSNLTNMSLLQAHQIRWQQLIEKVWELERTCLHFPIGLCIHSKEQSLKMIRVCGSNSLVLQSSSNSSNLPSSLRTPSTTEEQIHSKLDHLAWTIYKESSSNSLVKLEQDIYKWVSTGSCKYDASLPASCASLGNETCTQLFTSATIMDTLVPLWESLLSSSWITNYNNTHNMNGGVYSLVLDNQEVSLLPNDPSSNNKEQLVKSSAVVTRICVEQIRQMAVARCLLVGALSLRLRLKKNSFEEKDIDDERWKETWSAYLHVVAIQWCNSQTYFNTNKHHQKQSSTRKKIPPRHAFSPRKTGEETATIIQQPQLQKLRTQKDDGDQHQSVMIHPTLLEVRLMEFVTKESTVISLTRDFLEDAFNKSYTNKKLLPELSILPRGLKYPLRYSLRLLAPNMAYSCDTTNEKQAIARREMVAECFLVEAQFCTGQERVLELYQRSSDLLHENAPSISVDVDLTIAWETLQQVPDGWSIPHRLSDDYYNHSLLDFFQQILSTETIPEDSFRQLLSMQTVRSLFLPWIVTAGNANVDPLSLILNSSNKGDEDDAMAIDITNTSATVEESIRQLILVFLQICSLMHRVAILERHSTNPASATTSPTTGNNINVSCYGSSKRDGRSKSILDAIQEVIEVMELYLPRTDLVVEYGTLYSSAFRHAILCQDWKEALNSCLSNPNPSRVSQQYRRLVIAMVDAGQFGTFLQFLPLSIITQSNKEDEESLDVYELAVDTLVEASFEQSRSSSKNKSNYCGCLYALHASCGNWRRATQAIDLYGVVALSSSDENNNIMNQVSLAALASNQTVELVKNPNHRFIVSGEVGPYPLPHCFRDSNNINNNAMIVDNEETNQNKRNRDTVAPTNLFATQSSTGTMDSNRVTRILTQERLNNRAKKLLIIGKLVRDPIISSSSIDALSLLQASDKDTIDHLARLGYYLQAMLLASMTNSSKGNARQCGRDKVADAMSYIASKYIAPITTSEKDTGDDECMGGVGVLRRPTVAQLVEQIPYMTGSMIHDTSWMTLALSDETQKAKIGMKLLEHYITKYASTNNSLAIEVATKLLDLDNGKAKLPLWLTNLLLKSNSINDGLFASKQSSIAIATASDPSALLSLYIKRGLYVEACEVVSGTLLGNARRRQEASSRLPEKGNIDYVPYPTIDILWHFIQEQIDSGNDTDHTLLQARNRMERSLEEHFELMKLSEQGMHSARVLK